MTTSQVLIVCCAFVLAVGFVCATVYMVQNGTLLQAKEAAEPVPEHGLEALLRPLDNVAVDIGGNQALIGVVQTAERGVLTLTATEVHEGGQTTKITGLYHVPLEQVEGIQVKQSATPLRAVPEPAEVESA